jgi:hypothetical protein
MSFRHPQAIANVSVLAFWVAVGSFCSRAISATTHPRP